MVLPILETNTFLDEIAKWLNKTFPNKSVTTDLLKEFCDKTTNPILPDCNIHTFKDIVSLIEKHDYWDVMPFIFEQDKTFVQDLSSDNKLKLIKQLRLKSLYGFSIFYTVIRWGDVELLNLLIGESQLNNYDSNDTMGKELDKLLSNSLHLLLLRSVDISKEIKCRCEEILFDIRFFSKNCINQNKNETSVENRINFVLELIDDCDNIHNYSHFLLTIKTIAQNLFLLMKHNKISKEHSNLLNQMQFLLALYINKSQGKYNVSLSFNPKKIIKYLNLFKVILKSFISDKELNADENKLLAEFTEEVQLNRSVLALTRIAYYIKVIDNHEEDKIVMRHAIERCLQVTGENLKCSNMSPNISSEVVDIFDKSAPNFLKHIRETRDALSHVEYLRSRLKITNEEYFKLKIELKSIFPKIVNIIYMQRFIQFAKQSSKNLDIINVASSCTDSYSSNLIDCDNNKTLSFKDCFSNTVPYLDDYLSIGFLKACLLSDNNDLDSNDKLWYHFCRNIKSSNDKELLELLIKIIDSIHNIKNIEDIFVLNSLETGNRLTDLFKVLIEKNNFNCHLLDKLTKINIDTVNIASSIEKIIRNICKKSNLDESRFLECLDIGGSINESFNNNEIEEKFNDMSNVFNAIEWKDFSKNMKLLYFKIFCLNIKELSFKTHANDIVKEFNKFFIKIYGNKQLRDSKSIISNWLTPNTNDLIKPVGDKLKYLINVSKTGEMHKIALEMCVLDILELYKNNLSHNTNAPFNKTYPILLGKELRNYLAHYNSLFDQFSIDHFVVLTANKLADKLILEKSWKIGLSEVCSTNNYIESKEIILQQSKLLAAAQRSTLEEFKSCLVLGDVASNQNNLNIVKSAVIGDNLEIFQYIVNTTQLNINLKSMTIKYNSVNIFKYLLKLKGEEGYEMHYAILYNQRDIALNLAKSVNLVNSKSFCYNLTPLHLACLLGRYELANILMQSGAEIETRDTKYNAPIHLAAIIGYLDVLDLLLVNKAKINSVGYKNKTALHFAAGNGHYNLVTSLLSHHTSININIQDANGQSALHLAARAGYINIVKKLLEFNAIIDLKDVDGNTPAHISAISNNNSASLEFLIKSSIKLDSNENGDTILHLIKDSEIAKLLPIKELINIKNKDNRTPLHCAVINDNKGMVELLITNGANIYILDNLNKYPMDYDEEETIKWYFRQDVVEFATNKECIYERLSDTKKGNLIKHKMTSDSIINSLHYNGFVDVEKTMGKIKISIKPLTKNDMLLRAAFNGNVKVMKELIKDGADLYTKFEDKLNLLDVAAYNGKLHLLDKQWIQQLPGVTALFISASINYKDGIDILVNNGIHLKSMPSENKSTALHAASERGNFETMEILIKMGVDINAVNKIQRTALHQANISGNPKAIKLLLDNKVNVNAADKRKWTPLHLAVLAGHAENVELILENGGNINAASIYSETSLYQAASEGNRQIIEILIERGANINATAADGKSPLHVVTYWNDLEVIKMLLEKGANINALDINDSTPLHQATYWGHQQIVELLLEKGADINASTSDGRTPLHEAAHMGYQQIIELLLKKGANINAASETDETPLHEAAVEGYQQIIQLFLDKGANINADTIDGETILYNAAYMGHLNVVELLIEKGANINATTVNGITPLHITAFKGHFEIVKLLLTKGANINAVTPDGRSAIYEAVSENHQQIIELLLVKGANINVAKLDGETLLHRAASKSSKEIIEFLLAKGAKVNVSTSNGMTPVYIAVFRNCKQMIELLLKNKADINSATADGMTPLHISSSNGYLEITKILIEKSANVNAAPTCGKTPIYEAAIRGHQQIIELLLKHGANINGDTACCRNPLQGAASRGNLQIIELLLEKGANINSTTEYGEICLYQAALYGELKIIKLLLDKGVNINAIDEVFGKTALHGAASEGRQDIVELLLEKGANINAVDTTYGRTALHEAAYWDHLHIVAFLIEKGANINAVDITYGQTALHEVASKGYMKIIELLLQKGADVNISTTNGRTALDKASSEGYHQIIELLLQKGAEINMFDSFGSTPLHKATLNGNRIAIISLLEHGADINATDHNKIKPIHMTAQNNNDNVMKMLVERGADINDKDKYENTIFHIASQYNSDKVIKNLLGMKIDNDNSNIRLLPSLSAFYKELNATDSNHNVTINDTYEINSEFNMKQLLTANINDRNKDARTAFHFASQYSKDKLIEIFINSDQVNINAADKNGWTALHFLIFNDNLSTKFNLNTDTIDEVIKKNNEVISSLFCSKIIDDDIFYNLLNVKLDYCLCKLIETMIKKGLNVNAVNKDGLSALHYAIMRGRIDCVKVLLKSGADINLVSKNGDTASTLVKIAQTRIKTLMLIHNDNRLFRLLKKFDKIETYLDKCPSKLQRNVKLS